MSYLSGQFGQPMPYGKDKAAMAAAGRKHANKLHTCKCGRQVFGNAYYVHRNACPVYKKWAEEWEKENA